MLFWRLRDPARARGQREQGAVHEKDFLTRGYSRSLTISFARQMKYWKSSPTNSARPAGVGAVSQRLIPKGHTIVVADAHHDDGKRFVVRSDEKETAFLELERITLESARRPLSFDPWAAS
jgi:hypothetical protein